MDQIKLCFVILGELVVYEHDLLETKTNLVF